MVRKLLIAVAVFFAATTATEAQFVVKVRPAFVVHSKPKPPSVRHIWIEPEWVWRNGNYVMINGYWATPRVGFVYHQGYWRKQRSGYVWVAGCWRRR